MHDLLRGIHYRNRWFYGAQNIFKLGVDFDERFKIAAEFVKPGQSVLDVCAGPGELQRYLPDGCRYSAIEASPQFNALLRSKGICSTSINLHQGLNSADVRADVVVMIVSLCHFRNSSMADLLEQFKTIAQRVVIVEDVLDSPRKDRSFIQKAMHHLCATDYYRPTQLFTIPEFPKAMHTHGYTCIRWSRRYWLGLFENSTGLK